MKITRGKFIAVEGIDGSGKDTQVDFLKKRLDLNKNIFLREPGSSESGKSIRRLILDHKEISVETQILLFYASRFETMKLIQKYLDEGKNVILNRFELSSYAYQIYGNKRKDLKNFMDTISNKAVPQDLKPDLYILFDLPVVDAKGRVEKREGQELTWFDKKDWKYFENVREGYKEEIQNYNHKIIDASKSIEEVKEDFLGDIIKFLEK